MIPLLFTQLAALFRRVFGGEWKYWLQKKLVYKEMLSL